MRGQQHVIAMRRRGQAPAAVFLEAFRTEAKDLPGTAFPSVEVEDSDTPARLDLRFLVGLQVHVLGNNERRVGRLMRAAVAAGASRVIASDLTSGRLTTTNEEAEQWPT